MKHVILLDAFAIAGGFVFRVVAGAEVIQVEISAWIVLCTVLGSLFLAFIAIIPSVVQTWFNFPSSVAQLLGGTSLLILVGVDLDTMSQVEGHLRMHHHEGIVRKGKIRSRYL